MKLRIFLKNGEILDFSERGETMKIVDDTFKFALSNGRLFILKCENGNFMINPVEISYMISFPDVALELDQLG